MTGTIDEIGHPSRIARLRKALLVIIALSTVAPLAALDLREPTVGLATAKLLAKLGSLSGMVLFVWQFVLGFRGAVSSVVKDLIWVVDLHKRLGKLASMLILLHPVFITLYYLGTGEPNPLLLNLRTTLGIAGVLGFVALAIVALLYVTSVSIRARLRKSTWYLMHLSSYVFLPIAFVHSFMVGSNVRGALLFSAWTGMAGLMALFFVYRMLFRLGRFDAPHVISRVTVEADEVVDIAMRPSARRVIPRIGQFIYFRRSPRHGARPYTAADYDPESGEIAITVKAAGWSSRELQNATPGERVGIDGPYGVFGRQALLSGRPLVMIAGGIGITPFRRMVALLERQGEPRAFLFYGSRGTDDIVYRDLLDSCRHVTVVHVLSEQPDYEGHQGFITPDILRQYCGDDLTPYEFLLCGPPIMVKKLEAALHKSKVPQGQVHHELFEW